MSESINVQGWQYVPVEPTPEILKAMTKVIEAAYNPANRAQMYHAQHTYKAMLAAAPKPHVQKCTCKVANAHNTAAVRKGYEMGGYVLEKCATCLAAPQPSDDVAKDALIAKLTTGLSEAKYRIEQGRVWNGMGWTLTGLHPHHQQQAIDAIEAAMGQGGGV